MTALKARPCIICGIPTVERTEGYKHPRCSDWLPCALRRNAERKRPKPVSKVVAEAIEADHPVPAELFWAVTSAHRRGWITDAQAAAFRSAHAA
jgi:hypothetical protein